MSIGFFETMIIKKLKSNKNKTKIVLCVNNEIELYNHFSVLSNNIEKINSKINNEIIDYLLHETEKIHAQNSLIIILKTFENINSIVFEKLLKDNINEKLSIIQKEIKQLNFRSLILSLAGMFLLGFTQIFQIFEKRYSLNEFIIVMSWVFMWKAVELFFFERAKIVKQKGILLKINCSEIIPVYGAAVPEDY